MISEIDAFAVNLKLLREVKEKVEKEIERDQRTDLFVQFEQNSSLGIN